MIPDLDLNLLYGCVDANIGETALHAAVRENHVHIVKFLIESGANIEMERRDHIRDLRPLHEAAKQANPDMVRILLDAGADIQAKFDNGHGDDGLATSLVLRHMEHQRNYWPQVDSGRYRTQRDNSHTVMGELGIKDPGVEGLFNLAYYGPRGAVVDMARMLFDAAMTDPNRDPNFPNTEWVQEQLREAACHNNLPLVQFLLDRGVDVNGLDRYGESPLLAACLRFGMWRSSSYCWNEVRIRTIVSLNSATMRAGAMLTAERTSSRAKLDDVVRFLLQSGVDVEARNTNRETPLLTHARKPAGEWGDTPYNILRLECFRLLVESCRDIDAVDSKCMSAMHLIACNAKDAPTAKKAVDLLIQNGANPNIRDHEGVTGAARLQAKLGIELDLAAILGWVVL
ncbi:hypothetical protein GGTG_01752 [Gaeumannomyces tritici R3-111a-1]|uniref:Uncharacterized protein n=1 Tax=Gaeumannomyces tritici (strain R3-111a-1) TaxID=644352 RepID=J3NKG3_GAET3|nr:hypothetical protein GGTG_01752 [Gaeumannomyces tritici R3-111a-1]EJT81777.1 hypothetical protein GGTG_01752 [Gaeumannomyces tritici R3-111a-1]